MLLTTIYQKEKKPNGANVSITCIMHNIMVYLVFARKRLHPTDLPPSILPMPRSHMDLGVVLEVLKQ